MIFVLDDASGTGTSEELAAIDAFNARLVEDSMFVMAAGISAPARATLIDHRVGTTTVDSGRSLQGRDFYSGFWIVEVPTAEQAVEVAARGSAACNRRVELRPFLA